MITGIAGQLGVNSDAAFVDFNANNMFKGERGHVTVDDISSMVVYYRPQPHCCVRPRSRQ